MKSVFLTCLLLGLAAQAFADDFDNELIENNGEGRIFFNTSSTATSLTLLGALILLGVIAYLVYAGGLLGSTAYKRQDYYDHEYAQYQDAQYAQYRSNEAGFDFNSMNILQWISTLRDMYEKFDVNDIECQKRRICEIMREPDTFGSAAQKFKNGFQYARYMESFMPEEMQAIFDEYNQANDRALDGKPCEDFFPCDYSLKASYSRTLTGNGL